MNARDAMAEGGALSIATSGAPQIPKVADLPDPDYVIMEVRNFGCSIAQEQGSKVYEPFFAANDLGARIGLDGPRLIRRVRQSRQALKFVFISGYFEDSVCECIDYGTVVRFLAKPFSLQDLAGKVKETMHAAVGRGATGDAMRMRWPRT